VNPAGMMANGVSDRDELRKTMMATHPVDDDEGEDPQLAFWVAVGTLTASTVVIALCAEFMVGSIDAVTASSGLGEEFVGLILLPIVGNAAEHATAVTVAIKDKMDLAIGVAVGSSMQVALFLIPLLVIIGWGMGIDDMTMSFDLFQVAVMFVSVLLVNYLIGDGKSHWLEGMLLICLYFIIAVCTFCKFNIFFASGAVANLSEKGTPTETRVEARRQASKCRHSVDPSWIFSSQNTPTLALYMRLRFPCIFIHDHL
jgi:Ca2+:H+ antiporter